MCLCLTSCTVRVSTAAGFVGGGAMARPMVGSRLLGRSVANRCSRIGSTRRQHYSRLVAVGSTCYGLRRQMGSVNWVQVGNTASVLSFMAPIATAMTAQVFDDGHIWHENFLYCRVLSNSSFIAANAPQIRLSWLYVAEADAANLVQPVLFAWCDRLMSTLPGYQFYAPVCIRNCRIARPSAVAHLTDL